MSAATQGAAPGFGTYGGSSGSMTPVTFVVYDSADNGGVYVTSAPVKQAGGDAGEYGNTFTPDS